MRAHNWVVLGALLDNPGQPPWCLPLSGRLYFRKSQLPLQSQDSDHTVVFRTKCELVVELIREQARITGGRHLGIFDGAYALRSVVRPLVQPGPGHPRIEFLTRLRPDARLYALPPPGCRANQKWGRRLPPPCQGGRWSGPWQEGEGFIYGRQRHVRWKEQVCLWWVAGAEVPVKVVVAEVEGYRQRFHLVSSATELTGVEMVEGFAGRFRQEDVFRDLKQRLGWEECRAWTQAPIERTSQVQWVTLSLLRLAQFRLASEGSTDWWLRPPWNLKKDRPSVLDVERLLRRHGSEIRNLLAKWLGKEEGAARDSARQHLLERTGKSGVREIRNPVSGNPVSVHAGNPGEILCQFRGKSVSFRGNPVSVHNREIRGEIRCLLEIRCRFIILARKDEPTSRQESSGKGDSWKLETFQMEPCG